MHGDATHGYGLAASLEAGTQTRSDRRQRRGRGLGLVVAAPQIRLGDGVDLSGGVRAVLAQGLLPETPVRRLDQPVGALPLLSSR